MSIELRPSCQRILYKRTTDRQRRR